MARADEIASLALEQPAATRADFLDRACGGDAALRRGAEERLERLLQAAAYFDTLGKDVALAAESAAELPGVEDPHAIGRYRTLRLIGRGGMGSVFLAERADGQFEQRVAIKLVRAGSESGALLRRFLAERQILARLQHPGIARLLDGGVARDGRPYYVMEHVEGVPLTSYCDERRLGVEARLALLRQVCEAVQFAHRNLVVHRDLKPSNVLVTREGRVKLLDFGIAKLLDDGADEATELTATGQRLLTRAYAAPEQFRGEAVTTATDVYALGVVLYELLAGRQPFPTEGRTASEQERAVLEETPPPPSAVAAAPRLRRRLRGELDTICLMALRKEPERRYSSVEQLAADLRRHLVGLPIVAHQDSIGYRASKFFRRHSIAAAATLLLLALAVGSALAMAVQSARTARERDKAERVATLFAELLRLSDPVQGRGASITVRELLDRGAASIEKGLAAEPEMQAALLLVLARTYQNLGLYDRAILLAGRSLEARRRLRARPHAELAESLKTVGDLQRLQGDYAKAEPLLRDALAQEQALFGPRDARVGDSLDLLGKLLVSRGRYAEAEQAFRDGLAAHRHAAERGGDRRAVAASLSDLAAAKSQRGHYDEAERLTREALALHRDVLGDKNPRVATALNNLGAILAAKGDRAGAEAAYSEALAQRRKLLEPEHPEIAQTANNLGLLLQDLGRDGEAEALHREALAIRSKALGEEHPLRAASLNNLGLLLLGRGRPAEAEPLFRQGLAILEKRVGGQHPLVAISFNNLGQAALEQGRIAEARARYQRSLEIRSKALRPGHPDLAWSLLGLGRVELARGDARAARPLLQEAVAIRQAALPPESWETAEARAALGECLNALGNRAEAEAELRAAHGTLLARRGPKDVKTLGAARALAQLLRDTGRTEEARRLLPS